MKQLLWMIKLSHFFIVKSKSFTESSIFSLLSQIPLNSVYNTVDGYSDTI